MFSSRTDKVACLVFFILSLVVFTRGLNVHGLEYRDDEIFYFQSTQEMVDTGNILSPTYFGEDRFQKPILYYWFVLLSYKIFGISWFGARFVAVVFAGLTVCVTWLLGRVLFGRATASLGAMILMTVPLFFRHAKNVVPDMPLNFFIVLAVYCAVRFIRNPSNIFSVLFFVSCALGFMIKGFAALIVPILTIIAYSLWVKKPRILADIRFGRGVLIMLLIMCPWFFYMIKVHGQEYLNYMLVDETKNRLVNTGGGPVVIRMATTFFDHCLFYLNVIGTYFAPWSVFLIGAIPLAFMRIRSEKSDGQGLRLMLAWFFVVFCFFSTMYFSINHYMLVLSTPFALLVSYFLLEAFQKRAWGDSIIRFLRKSMLVFILTAGSLVFIFLFVFLAGSAKWWVIVFLALYVVMVREIYRNASPMAAPLILALFMLFVFAQSTLLDKAGVTAHATLQKFAGTIHERIQSFPDGHKVIGVGSHDIHEKEFQVYFDQRVIKAAGSEVPETKAKLDKLLATDSEVFCLMTQEDFEYFLRGKFPGSLEVIQEDYIFRRRMNIDKGFFMALLQLDQTTVRHYLKEKIVLIRKEGHV